MFKVFLCCFSLKGLRFSLRGINVSNYFTCCISEQERNVRDFSACSREGFPIVFASKFEFLFYNSAEFWSIKYQLDWKMALACQKPVQIQRNLHFFMGYGENVLQVVVQPLLEKGQLKVKVKIYWSNIHKWH